MTTLPIGALARSTGVKVPTIRYYEAIGLLPSPDRTDSGRRVYGAEAVRRLGFIRHSRDLGFGIEAIRQLLALTEDPGRPCADADVIARERLAEIDTKIARLSSLRTEIEAMVEGCARGAIGSCKVIGALADQGQRVRPRH